MNTTLKILISLLASFAFINNCYCQKSNGKLVVEFDVRRDTVYITAELTGNLPDSIIAQRDIITEGLRASDILKNRPKRGKYTVEVQFILDKEGRVSDVKALTNNGYGLEEAAVRTIKKFPRWEPAMGNGRKVMRYRSLHSHYLDKTDSIRIAVDSANNLNNESFRIIAHKKILHSILYSRYSDSTGIVKISRQFSRKMDSTYQSFYLQNGKLIFAKEYIVSHFKTNNVPDSITWGGFFYFMDGRLLEFTAVGHGKSENKNWVSGESILKAYEESKRDIERQKKLSK